MGATPGPRQANRTGGRTGRGLGRKCQGPEPDRCACFPVLPGQPGRPKGITTSAGSISTMTDYVSTVNPAGGGRQGA